MVCLLENVLVSSYDNPLFNLRLYYNPNEGNYHVIDEDRFINRDITITSPFTAESDEIAIVEFNKFIDGLGIRPLEEAESV